jgi:hypothetical protein
MIGTKGTKSGNSNAKFPGILDTFKHCIGVIFLKDINIISLYLNPAHMLNLISVYLFMMVIPYKPMAKGDSFSVENVIEGILLTFFFICLLYLFLPQKKVGFLGFFRIMLAAEIIDVLNPVTFFLPDNLLVYFYAATLGWYFLIVVVVLNKFTGMPRHIGIVYVFCVFFVVNMIPAMFY